MSIRCKTCASRLEEWYALKDSGLFFCPACGQRIDMDQRGALSALTTNAEIDGIIRESLLDCVCGYDGSDNVLYADSIAAEAFSADRANGSYFCDTYKTKLFAARHRQWIEDALDYMCNNYGEPLHYTEMFVHNIEAFLVEAFIAASEYYLYSQLGIDSGEGILPADRIQWIIEGIKGTEYDGNF